MSMTEITYEEAIRCTGCNAEARATVRNMNGREWYTSLPAGWFIADSFPPGDAGVIFACSPQCADEHDPIWVGYPAEKGESK